MQVNLKKSFSVEKPMTPVWGFLSDPRKVAACVPGAQITEALDDRRFKGAISVKIGPVVTSYKGELVIERLDGKNFVIEMVGKGQDSKGRGIASMRVVGSLKPRADGGTDVMGSSEITITGLLAQFGSRVFEDISDQIFEQFTQTLRQNLDGLGASQKEIKSVRPLKAIPLIATASKSAILSFFNRVTGRSSKEQ